MKAVGWRATRRMPEKAGDQLPATTNIETPHKRPEVGRGARAARSAIRALPTSIPSFRREAGTAAGHRHGA